MASLDSVSIAIFLGAVLVMAGILSSLLALRFGAPLLLVFLLVPMVLTVVWALRGSPPVVGNFQAILTDPDALERHGSEG